MITVKLDKKYEIPFGWEDVSWNKFVEWLLFAPVGMTDDDKSMHSISFRTGIPQSVLYDSTIDSVNKLALMCAFYDNYDELRAINFVPKKVLMPNGEQFSTENFDVGQLPARTILGVQGAIKKASKRIKLLEIDASEMLTFTVAGAEIVEIYTGIDISERPVTEVYSLVFFFIKKSTNSLRAMLK